MKSNLILAALVLLGTKIAIAGNETGNGADECLGHVPYEYSCTVTNTGAGGPWKKTYIFTSKDPYTEATEEDFTLAVCNLKLSTGPSPKSKMTAWIIIGDSDPSGFSSSSEIEVQPSQQEFTFQGSLYGKGNFRKSYHISCAKK